MDLKNVEASKIYYFPDPFKYGSETTSLIFDVDPASFRKGINYSFFWK